MNRFIIIIFMLISCASTNQMQYANCIKPTYINPCDIDSMVTDEDISDCSVQIIHARATYTKQLEIYAACLEYNVNK